MRSNALIRRVARLSGIVAAAVVMSCASENSVEREADGGSASVAASISDPVDVLCALPSDPVVLLEEEGAVLQMWSLTWRDVYSQPVLPPDAAFLAYRRAIRAERADLERPPPLIPGTETEIWRDERHNNDLAYSGAVGSIDPITCLDALLFAEQHSRFSQLDHPTEFIASILRRRTGESDEVMVIFGASDEMFPPGSFYGFDVADAHRAQGWNWAYVLHNHTLQDDDGSRVLGVPVPSTSDVELARVLAEQRGLESARVTNGFFTFRAQVRELVDFRAR